MLCPHKNCGVTFHDAFGPFSLTSNNMLGMKNGRAMRWQGLQMECPACHRPIIYLCYSVPQEGGQTFKLLAYPVDAEFGDAASEVPGHLAEDYNEAAKVMSLSPKASAALSRRCLQALLRDQGFDHKDLAPAIQALLDAKTLPSTLAANVDAIRNVGNFAAHPMKDSNTGEILPVEEHEAEWNLEVLEGLFDFYYVQPAKDAARRAAINAKLAAAGKPPLKT